MSDPQQQHGAQVPGGCPEPPDEGALAARIREAVDTVLLINRVARDHPKLYERVVVEVELFRAAIHLIGLGVPPLPPQPLVASAGPLLPLKAPAQC